MKKIKQIFTIILMVTLLTASTAITFAADDDLPVPRIMIQSVIEEQ